MPGNLLSNIFRSPNLRPMLQLSFQHSSYCWRCLALLLLDEWVPELPLSQVYLKPNKTHCLSRFMTLLTSPEPTVQRRHYLSFSRPSRVARTAKAILTQGPQKCRHSKDLRKSDQHRLHADQTYLGLFCSESPYGKAWVNICDGPQTEKQSLTRLLKVFLVVVASVFGTPRHEVGLLVT